VTLAPVKDPAMGELGYERVEGDFYPTPPENLDCLGSFIDLEGLIVWEPACGEGHLSKRLSQLGAETISSDLFHRGFGQGGIDFLRSAKLPPVMKMNAGNRRQAIITNPPYGDLAEAFIRKALMLTEPEQGIVAMFLRNEYDMAATGRNDLFEGHPAYFMKVAVTKRPRWIAGSTGSPRHNYAWYVWDWSKPPASPAQIRYIHPKHARPCGQIERGTTTK
jgi:hypothetical protein